MNLWIVFSKLLYEGLRIATLSRVTVLDEGGLAALDGSTPVLLAANHQSHADTSVIFFALPRAKRTRARFVASGRRFRLAPKGAPLKERLERWMLTGLALRVFRAILVGGEDSGLRAIELIASALEHGDIVVMYPEGTRSLTGALGSLKPGVAMLAISTHCVVVPVRVEGTLHALPKSRRFPRLMNRITVRFRAPLTAASCETHEQFLARVALAIAPTSYETAL